MRRYAIEILIYGQIWNLKDISVYDFLEITEQYLAIREGYVATCNIWTQSQSGLNMRKKKSKPLIRWMLKESESGCLESDTYNTLHKAEYYSDHYHKIVMVEIRKK